MTEEKTNLFPEGISLVLASASPRRKALLEEHKIPFRAVTAAIAAMVAITGVKMRKKTVTTGDGVVIALICFFAITVFRFSPPVMIAFAVAAGILLEAVCRVKRGREEKR